jgi:hypothetical protein
MQKIARLFVLSFRLSIVLMVLYPSLAWSAKYDLVDVIHVTTKDFKYHKDSKAYAEIPFPVCATGERKEIDIGDYLLGPDCFYGEPQQIEVRAEKNQWLILLPYCYSGHLVSFSRNVHVYCVANS